MSEDQHDETRAKQFVAKGMEVMKAIAKTIDQSELTGEEKQELRDKILALREE
jgi:hypothetical protein